MSTDVALSQPQHQIQQNLSPPQIKVQKFLKELLDFDAIEIGFNCFLSHKPEIEKANQITYREEFIKLCQSLHAENTSYLEIGIKYYAAQAAEVNNVKKLEQLFGFLYDAVGRHVVPARLVCEVLLHCPHLSPSPPGLAHWVETLRLVRRLVGGVDYKGVREIMKNCIEKASQLPVMLHSGLTPQLDSLIEVLTYIFDRNSALLPGYFIVNEILKSYPESSLWPHWRLVTLVSNFLSSFRPAALIVSVANQWRLVPLVEQLGRAHLMSTWKLDPASLKFLLKGSATYERILPYCKELTQPQPQLLKYLLSTPYSKDLVSHLLNLQKPRKDAVTASGRCIPLEQQLVSVLVDCMHLAEEDPHSEVLTDLFRNLASDLIYFVLFQFVSFPAVITDLGQQLSRLRLSRGRDKLMWLLLQFISGSIQKNPTTDFLPVLKLYSMYEEAEPLPLPDTNSPSCVEEFSATGIYIHLARKASSENLRFAFRLPVALQSQHDYLLHAAKPPVSSLCPGSYLVATLCNTFSTTSDLFLGPMSALVEAVGGGPAPPPGHASMPGTNCVSALPCPPIHMQVLDSLSVHAKMSLIHSIVTHILKQVQQKNVIALSPSIVETYSRLLVYSEMESLGIKGFLNQLMPKVYAQQAWGSLHTLLEIFSYRLHHIQAHYRLSLLTHLHQLASHNIFNSHAQLHLTVESSALRLITGFGNSEIAPPKAQAGMAGGAPKSSTTLYGDSEELNRVVILTLARAVHIGGLEQNGSVWLKEVVTSIMHSTPHAWPTHTLQSFPQVLVDLLAEHPGPKDTGSQLKKCVEEEWSTWGTMNNENDIIAHFSLGSNNLFLCLLWKMILQTDDISPIAYKVLERIGAKQLTGHLRAFCDFLVHEFSKSGGGGHVNKCIDAMNNMIWKYNIITIDRLVLCMALRHHEGNEAQVCFFIIQLLLLKPEDFRNRVNEFCRTMQPDHHLQQDWHTKHLEIHEKYPEKFGPEVLTEKNHNFQTLPTYYGNVCLRFIPVFDIVVHRFLELPTIQKSLETLFDHLGCLYKFHVRPLSYLYNTLHYYEARLRERASLRKKIVDSITDALKDVKPQGWALTQEIHDKYLGVDSNPEDIPWRPGSDYFFRLVQRMVLSLDPTSYVFPRIDWRFSEFPNEGSHCLYVTCVELMTLPYSPEHLGEKLIDVVLQTHSHIPAAKLPEWINAVGLLLSNLPEAYWAGLYKRLEQSISRGVLSDWSLELTPTQLFDFQEVHRVKGDTSLAYLLAVTHSTWQHCGFTQLCGILELVRDRLSHLVETEEQMLFVFHLVGPFLQRLHADRFMRVLFELTVQLYELLLRVDRRVHHLKHIDSVCDLLYHIKYQFTGDSVKSDAERVVRQLRPALQLRLRFIAQVQIGVKPGEEQASGQPKTDKI